MDQSQNFTYDGWTFRREIDGALIVEPPGVSKGSQVFQDQPSSKTQAMQPLTIPSDEVHRLIGYCLTGDQNNSQVIQSLREQYGSKSLVK